MTAGLATMQLFDQAAVDRVNALGARARDGIAEAIRSTGVRACVTGGGSMFRVHFKAEPPTNYRDVFPTPDESRQLRMLLDHLFDEGFLVMGESEIDGLVEAMAGGFAAIRDAG
jgi:glutamate-1-semialdehyde 2,1-aminomutase